VTAFWRFSTSALLALAACGPVPRLVAQGEDLPPAGYGTLRQDQVAIRLTTPNLAVRALPLDERIIRLLAPDTYASLVELRRSRTADIASASRVAGVDSATVFVVTFFGLQPETRFEPDQVYISSQNAFFRPIGVVPVSPRWSEGQLRQREQAVAIYLFQPGIALLQPLTLYYAERSSNAWEATLRTIEAERSRVLARAAGQPRP
jgi:hypothetical protein